MATVPTFIDTSFIYALINTRDEWHDKASLWQQRLEKENRPLITTQLILIEVGNGLSKLRFRHKAVQILNFLQLSPVVDIVSLTNESFALAFELFESRTDKDWGLTDCVSFIAMEERAVTEALTTDIHFRQAGFNALLLD